jgi:hypothetical protein
MFGLALSDGTTLYILKEYQREEDNTDTVAEEGSEVKKTFAWLRSWLKSEKGFLHVDKMWGDIEVGQGPFFFVFCFSS